MLFDFAESIFLFLPLTLVGYLLAQRHNLALLWLAIGSLVLHFSVNRVSGQLLSAPKRGSQCSEMYRFVLADQLNSRILETNGCNVCK